MMTQEEIDARLKFLQERVKKNVANQAPPKVVKNQFEELEKVRELFTPEDIAEIEKHVNEAFPINTLSGND